MSTVSLYAFHSSDRETLQEGKQKGTLKCPVRKMRLDVKEVMGVVETRTTTKPDDIKTVGVVGRVRLRNKSQDQNYQLPFNGSVN